MLAYSHYEIDRSYIQTDFTKVDWKRDGFEKISFWEEYFRELQKRFDWELLTGLDTESLVSKKIEFQDEGKGVSAVKFQFDEHLQEKSKILHDLQSTFSDFDIDVIDNKKKRDYIAKMGQRVEYDDVLFLDLDIVRFDVFRTTGAVRTRDTNLKDINSKPWETHYHKISWDSRKSLAGIVKDSRVKAFLGYDPVSSSIHNKWANIIYGDVVFSDNPFVKDLIRSFTTVQLMSIFNRNSSTFKKLAQKGKRVLVYVLGDVLNFIDYKEILISVLDGFQIKGAFDMYIDRDFRFYHLIEEFVEGVNAKNYITTRQLMFEEGFYKVMVPEVPSTKSDKKSVFSASITVKDAGSKEFIAFTPEITTIELGNYDERYIVDGVFTNDSYIEGGLGWVNNEPRDRWDKSRGERVTINSDALTIDYRSLVIDGRYRPIVYGPDYRKNSSKLSSWFND